MIDIPLLLFMLAMPPAPTPMADAVGTMGRYVPEPVGMVGSWQMAGYPAPHAKRGCPTVAGTLQSRGSGPPSLSGFMCGSIPAASADADSSTVHDDADDRTSRLDLGLGIISISAAMVARGLTSSCLASKTCHERIALTRWLFDHGPVWGVVAGAAINGLIHYAVARWVPKGKYRTFGLGMLAGINVTNAALDTYTVAKIEKDAGR